MANTKPGALGRAMFPGWSKVFDEVFEESNMSEARRQFLRWKSKMGLTRIPLCGIDYFKRYKEENIVLIDCEYGSFNGVCKKCGGLEW